MLDWYEVLQVSPNAEHDVIEAAYRRLSRKYHPDVNQDPRAPESQRLLNADHTEADQHHGGFLEALRAFLSGYSNLQMVGRNGLHKYNNQDHAMLTSLLAVRNVLGEKHDVWAVNTEEEYHEARADPSAE